MDIESLTFAQMKQIASIVGGVAASQPSSPFAPGSAWLIRTVTMAWTGRVRAVVGGFVVLDEAAWIPDTGRFHLATEEKNLSEIEPVGDGVVVGLGSIVDAKPWTTALPKNVK